MKKSIRTILILLTICALLILAYAVIPDVSRDLNKYGRLVYDRNGKILRAFLNDDEQWCFEPVDNKIPPKLEKVVLLYEDRWFYRHPGFNPVSIIQALVTNIKAGRVISGGSTITMQVCRLARPGNRTVIKKFSELLQAIKLEIKYSKKQILSMYLNNAPYGGNIVGIRAASLKYFGREPEHLSWAEAAVLAVLPPAA
jgi:penicillin-binding protein 1C